MATKTSTDKLNNMSSTAVEKATGKTWPQWLKALDAAGCKKMNHKQIVTVVHEKFGPWWQQMVTVGYEQARGLRELHQKVDGYSFSISRTIPASTTTIFDAFTKPAQLKRWMNGDQFEVTTATRGKSLRMKWPDDTRVNVMLYPKSVGKAQVVVEHNKIASSTAMKKLKSYWAKRVEELQAMLTK
ncbi:MAG: hypothetical protein H7Z14_13745 [Anaerolineae bacterium]|nr:hypothetical protein [Phycisphaerae bacterium]